MLVYQTSMPPEPAVNSTVSFWRAWISGSVANSTLMPVCFSKSGSNFSMVSAQGFLVNWMKILLPLNRCQLNASPAPATRRTNGPTAAPAATPAPSRSTSRRVIPREPCGLGFRVFMKSSCPPKGRKLTSASLFWLPPYPKPRMPVNGLFHPSENHKRG